ncbi:hypothetical protein DYQ86_05455 [Acidobacteria bacterium AB60]|nr:hypothetical protein DYQ86_05455 [Acidobacteria bacterium AB60]
MPLKLRTSGWQSFWRMPLLKKLFWAYFLLLIFEGALRKWILPQFSAPLLLVRDPIAILIIWEAYRSRKWPTKWTTALILLSTLTIGLAIIQVVTGVEPWFAALYGLRSYLLPFPVAFIMAQNLDTEDLRKFAVCMLWLLLPLTALEVIQYIAPASSVWNKGAYEGTVQLASAGAHVRASATFSYVSGPMCYIPICAAFVFLGFSDPKFAKRWLIWTAAACLVLSVPVTGSRTVVFELGILIAFVGIAALMGVSQLAKTIQVIVFLGFVALLVSRLPVFDEATQTLTERFNEAASAEGSAEESLILRAIKPITVSIADGFSAGGNWLGQGMGYGSAAIAQLLTGSSLALVGEEEFPRVLGEFGLPSGLAYMIFRLLLVGSLAYGGAVQARAGRPLAWLLIPINVKLLLMGQMEQPTLQGFMVLSFALTSVAIRMPIGAVDSLHTRARTNVPRRLPSPGTAV